MEWGKASAMEGFQTLIDNLPVMKFSDVVDILIVAILIYLLFD
jgi:hypothetical protein